MINSKQIVKLGRSDKILDISDGLQVNDLYSDTGYVNSSLHNKFSRIKLALVDTKEGKKDKSKVGNFNLEEEAFNVIIKVLTLDPTPEKYKTNALDHNQKNKENTNNNDFLSALKIDIYKKNPNGKSPVSNIKLTYENGMRNDSKWKITIDIGECIPEKNGNLSVMKQGSYIRLKTATMNITTIELTHVLSVTNSYLYLWKQAAFPQMLENRNEFEKRAKTNNYNDGTIDQWNRNPDSDRRNKNSSSGSFAASNNPSSDSTDITPEKPNSNQPIKTNVVQNDIKINNSINPQLVNKCEGVDCGITVATTVKEFSLRNFGGHVYCIKCQLKKKKLAS